MTQDALPIEGSGGQEFFKRRYRFVIGGLALLANMAMGFNFYSPAPILPLIMDDFGISAATAGMTVTLSTLSFAAFGLPGGLIVSRIGFKTAIIIGAWLMALMALMAVVPNVGSLLALRLVYGVGLAFVFTSTGPMLMRWFGPKEVVLWTGLITAAFTMGIAISVAAAAPLSNAVGWSMALSIFAIVPMVTGLAWMLLGGPAGSASPGAATVSRKMVLDVLSRRTLLLLVAGDVGVFFQYSALTSWLPSFYNEVRNMSLSHAGFITGLLPFVGIFAVILGGILASRFGAKRALLVTPGIMVIAGGLGSFLFAHLGGIYASVIILGLGSWMFVPILLGLPMRLRGMTPEKVSVFWGFIVTIAGFGMFLSPIVVGGLSDLTGSFNPGFVICAVIACSLLVASILIPKADLLTDQGADRV